MNIVILNDTSLQNHFGCELVMRTFKEQLERINFKIIKTIPTHIIDISIPKNTDLVIVNGEGTIHHGAGSHLIQCVNKYNDIPFVLLNAVWQDNPVYDVLYKFKYICVRESYSFKCLPNDLDNVEIVPDIIFASNFVRQIKKTLSNEKSHKDIGITDNVVTTSNFNISSRTSAINFIRNISQYKRICCGRHHGVAIASMLEKPFSAWPSNTHKIEGMMKDMNILDLHFNSQSEALLSIPKEFDPCIRDYVARANLKIESMFNKLNKII